MMIRKTAEVMIAMATIFSACGGGASGQQVHRCAGAGRWFPANASQLRQSVERYLDAAKSDMPKGEIVALVSPHAGYEYSGPVAAYSYAAVRGRSYKRVILLALCHGMNYAPGLRTISTVDLDAYETPLGSIPVDHECVKALLGGGALHSEPGAHMREHSDENQLPFLQVALKPGWKLVPILVGQVGEADLEAAAKALRPYVFGDTLIVVSSDFTHLSNAVAAEQNKMDLGAAQLLVAKDYRGFRSYLRGDQGTICGQNPLALMLKLLDQDCTGHLLQHRLSGDLTGDWSYSVGYCSIVYTTPTKKPSPAKTAEAVKPAAESNPGAAGLQSDKFLTAEEEQALLKLARATLVEWVGRGSKKMDLSPFNLTPVLKRNAGAFVTFHKQGDLRGCIGYIEPIKPLHETVMDNARNAATNDPRFPAVTKDELDDIDIEISVMSPLRKVSNVNEIVVGKHGLVIKKGWNQGVFLPQVPVEQGWNLTQYLEGICRKASLPRGAWKEGAELLVFTAQVFGEKERPAGGK
jgi:hypothetical protein